MLRPLPAVLLLLLAACQATPTVPQVVRGPAPTRVNGPIVQQFLSPRPRAAETQEAGTLGTSAFSSYASVHEVGSNGTQAATFDGELWRTGVFLRYGIDKRSEIEVEFPFLWTSSGFLDGPIEVWHGVFGMTNGGREDRPSGEWGMSLESDGVVAFEMDPDEFGVCDIPVLWTYRLYDETDDRAALALRAGLELPVGSVNHGFGNGGLDASIGVVAEKSRGDWTFIGGVDYVAVSTPSGFEDAGLDAPDRIQGWLSCELRHDESTSWLAALRYAPPATDDVDLDEVERFNLDLDLGVAFELTPDVRLMAGFSEDLWTGSGVDLTGWVGVWSAR